jgi:macrodomain Ter protein organizer (MatP/YcbG family)
LKEQYSKNLTEITNSKNTDGLSGADKMMMNLSKIDEGITIMSSINIPMTIQYLLKRFDVTVTPEEVDFYIKHHKPQEIQIQLVRSFFAKYFGSYRDLHQCTRRDYIILMLILKKKLMAELGYDESMDDALADEIANIYNDIPDNTSENEESNDETDGENTEVKKTDHMMRPVALPYIISGNLGDHIKTRVIRNIKFTEKGESSYTFQKLQEENHKYLNFIKPGYDMALISSLINTRFTYVEYKYPQLLDVEITYNDDKIADEILFFLASV